MHTKQIYHLIREIPLFESVSDDTLEKLAKAMTLVQISGGDYLMKQGDPADCLYILAHGRLLVTVKGHDGSDKKIGEIGVGDLVGEMALLTDLPRSATVRAVRDCHLVKIDRQLFEKIVQNHTKAAMGVVSECVKRLLPNFIEKKHCVKSLCIVPCDASVDVHFVAHQLSESLAKYGKIKVIRSNDPDYLSHWNHDPGSIYSWLSDNEQTHDLVVFVADRELNDFTKLALSQSDKILRVTSPRAEFNEELLDYVNRSQGILAEKYLIILHDDPTKMPSGTTEILKKIPCSAHFHVAKKADFDRVARYLLGRSVCAVFSGGGLRGIAHQGMITALYERGFPIDMVAGTSFGSLPAVFAALGYTPDEMLEAWKEAVDKIRKIIDFTLPLAAISKGGELHDMLVEAISPSIYVEDLWLPMFCVSTNITTFRPKMHVSGPAWEAVRASLAIPGIFPPVIDGDNVLVDGASMNNLPVDLMSTINNQGTIIASIASGKTNMVHYEGYKDSLSGWKLLFDKIVHRDRSIVPSIAETMMAASLSASSYHQEQMQKAADYTFDLGVDGYKLLDIENWMKIRETGYKNTLRLIDEYELTPEKLGV